MLGSRGCTSTDTASTACLSRPKGEQRGAPTAGAGYDIKGGFFLKKKEILDLEYKSKRIGMN